MCSMQELRQSLFRFQLFPAMGALVDVGKKHLSRTGHEFIVQIELYSHTVVIALIHLDFLSIG
jgi:hypothetical protein